MDEFLDEFLPWFLFMMGDEFECPHCGYILYEDEISESGDDYVVCPHCGEEIQKSDFN